MKLNCPFCMSPALTRDVAGAISKSFGPMNASHILSCPECGTQAIVMVRGALFPGYTDKIEAAENPNIVKGYN